MLNVFRLTLFNHQHRAFAKCKFSHLLRHQRVGDVQHQQGDLTLPKRIAQAKLLQGANQRVVNAALHDDADVLARPVHQFIELLLQNVAARCGDALRCFQFFLCKGDGRVCQLGVVKGGWFSHQLPG